MGPRGMGPRGNRGEGPQIMFQKADKDNSGTVTLEEFAAASPFAFTDADADGDGNITAQELADQMERQMLLRRAEMMIKRFDTDNDGKVSTAEIENRQKEMFARLDIDGSGRHRAGRIHDAAAAAVTVTAVETAVSAANSAGTMAAVTAATDRQA
jgi:hypothetical protein